MNGINKQTKQKFH